MFTVEVGGDDEVSILIESFECLGEDLLPDWFVIPVVLMAEEGDVWGANFGEVTEAVATVGDEVDAGFGGSLREFCFPT